MDDRFCWLGRVLRIVNRARPGQAAGLAELERVAARIDARAETIARSIEMISERLHG